MTDIWHADSYATFLDLRTKVAKDLLFAIPDTFSPRTVYDLGCGPGNSTVLLTERWPQATVIGMDSSEQMLNKARELYPDTTFIAEDIADFAPAEPVDCIFSNAALQWLDHHDVLMPRLLSFLKPGGFLAIEIPNNYHCPSHQVTIRLLDQEPKWRHLLGALRYGYLNEPFYNPYAHYDLFAAAKQVQLWQTDYLQEMPNHQAIFAWVQGTGLRPVLTKMTASDQVEFEKRYVAAIAAEYPVQKNGKVLLGYKRLFIVASV